MILIRLGHASNIFLPLFQIIFTLLTLPCVYMSRPSHLSIFHHLADICSEKATENYNRM